MLNNMIDITGANLVEVAKAAYDLSVPQGMEFLHAIDGPMSNEHAASLIKDGRLALQMDYVNGRACKLTVFRYEGKLLIRNNWFDHSEDDLIELLDRIGF